MLSRLTIISFFVLLSLFSYGQMEKERFNSKEVLIANLVDSCSIYKVNHDSTLTLEQYIVYDLKGNEIEWEIRGFNFHWEYVNDRKVKRIWLACGDTIQTDTFLYDNKERLKSITSFVIHNSQESIRTTEYLFKGCRTVIKRKYYDGENSTESVYKYDRKKRLKSKLFIKSDSTFHLQTFKYDINDNLVFHSNINQDGDTLKKYELIYDHLNRQTEEIQYWIGELNKVKKTYYDEKGLIEYEEFYDRIRNGDIKQSYCVNNIFRYSFRQE